MRRGVVIRMVINDLTFDVPPKTHASAVRDRLITAQLDATKAVAACEPSLVVIMNEG